MATTLNPLIVNVFEASTCHMSASDNKLLHEDSLPAPVVYPYEFGDFIYVGEEDESVTLRALGFSEEFVSLVLLARVHNCKYLQLDGEGTVYDDLPKFDW